MHPILNIAIRAARIAGNLILKYYEIPNTFPINQKESNNFITRIINEVECLIVNIVRKSYPQHSFLCKKRGKINGENIEIQWIIDPLDGVVNYIKRFPHFAVSIAVQIKNCIEVAVIYDPIRNELFTASRGQGAKLNAYRLRGSNTHDLEGSILAISFLLKQKHYTKKYTALMNKLCIYCADFRHSGSTALDFAYVAAGRVDGFLNIGFQPWNLISGELLVREAGGLLTNFTGMNNYLISDNIIAGNSRIIKAIFSKLHNELNNLQGQN